MVMKPIMEAAFLCVLLIGTIARVSPEQTPEPKRLTLGALIQSGMVLQQGIPVRIHGFADTGERVTVSVQGKTATAVADAKRNWTVVLPVLAVGGPFTMTVKAGAESITLDDILVGEVWVCSGQSNMEWILDGAQDGIRDKAAANDPMLRMFTVTKRISGTPLTTVDGKWEAANPQNAGHFSAVGYYFARALRRARNVPVGIIHTSWGGTPIEAWTSRQTLLANGFPESAFEPENPNSPEAVAQKALYEHELELWKAAGSPHGLFHDPGIAAVAKGWEQPDIDVSSWKTIKVPGLWEQANIDELATADGAVWFRKEIDLPAPFAGKEMVVQLGAIDDNDTTYFNGTKIGGIGATTNNAYSVLRKYTIPGNLVKAGKNVITVRVWDSGGGGGFNGPADVMQIYSNILRIAPMKLAGDWKYRIENIRPGEPTTPNHGNPNAPSVLYNAMLKPLTNYTIKGALWYQGESNVGRHDQYRALLPAMIDNWRQDWNEPAFPFFFVQLAPFGNGGSKRIEYAQMRETMDSVARTHPKTDMAVITDVGNETDIHPRQKTPVGERLALLAREIAYGEKIEGISPRLKGVAFDNDRATVTFEHVGTGLEIRGTSAKGFEIAAIDGDFVPAEAVVVGKDKVTVSSPKIPNPARVRYGFRNYIEVNLWSKDGLPAAPFRSDSPQAAANL